MRFNAVLAMALAACTACAETVIDISGAGAEKRLVSVDVECSATFTKTLERNLILSGAFRIAKGAPIKVSGRVGESVTVSGGGKRLTMSSVAMDDKAARTEARILADKMCEAYAGQKGFANDKLAFVVKRGRSEELCVGYADGGDVKQLTRDAKASVGPRWNCKGNASLYYTGYLNNAPEVFEIDVASGKRRLAWGFGGLTTGATVAPDGTTVALIISKPFRNPELCTIDPSGGTWKRLTTTKSANEGQPSWAPDGRKIVYVSDESRRQHLYVIDPFTRDKRRLTSQGQNVDPDWGPDGRIVYTTRRGGLSQIAVLSPADGDSTARLVTEPGAWEHPTWTRDMRHVVAERDGALFLIDTLEGGDKPLKLFSLSGRCITPSMSR